MTITNQERGLNERKDQFRHFDDIIKRAD